MERQMRKILITVYAVLLTLWLVSGQVAIAGNDDYFPSNGMEQGNNATFTPEELDEMLAAIALYPDPLIAQILPAATFADQIDLAARYVRQYGSSARIDDQPWDVSVRSVAHYPDLLYMMDQKYDWTASIGQAYLNQQLDVMDAIQRLRARARSAGNLVSTPQQQVLYNGGVISIYPAVPNLIYLPRYDPLMVYAENLSPGYGLITFGLGLTIGAWLNRDFDWYGRRIYYHGWQGTGWISSARPYIPIRNNIYINNRFITVNTSKKIIQRDTVRYREEIRSNVLAHQKPAVRITPPSKVKQAAPPLTVIRPAVRPEISDVYRGRDNQKRKPQPVSQTGYGGYGSNKDAASYRDRGQTSRVNMQPSTRPAPVKRAPVSIAQPPAQRAPVLQPPRQAPAGGVIRKQR